MGRAFLSVHRAAGQGAHLLHGGGPVRGKGGKEGGREGGWVGGWEVLVHRAGRQGAHLLYGGGQVRSEGGREGGRKEGSALLALCFNRSDCLTPNSSLPPSLPPSLLPSLPGLCDRYLLCFTNHYGYGNWEDVRMAIRRCDRFRFDYFLRSCTADNLGKRCEQLMRAAESKSPPSLPSTLPPSTSRM